MDLYSILNFISSHPNVFCIIISILGVGVYFRNLTLAKVRNGKNLCARCGNPLDSNKQEVNMSDEEYADLNTIVQMCSKCTKITGNFSKPTAAFMILFAIIFILFLILFLWLVYDLQIFNYFVK